MQGGIKGELNIGKLLGKRAGVIATALRGAPGRRARRQGRDRQPRWSSTVWPMIADGRVRPIIGAELPIEQAAEAHELLASGEVTGKVVLRVSD